MIAAGNLMERLRNETSRQHSRLEEIIDYEKRFSSRATYSDYLSHIHPAIRSLEGALEKLAWDNTGIDFRQRKKLDLLEADLNFFGKKPAPLKGKELTDFSSVSAGIGALYVLEGSTLGGQFLLRFLEKNGVGSKSGASFLAAYGSRTAGMWNQFKQAAMAYCDSEPRVNEAVESAGETFDFYAQHIEPLS